MRGPAQQALAGASVRFDRADTGATVASALTDGDGIYNVIVPFNQSYYVTFTPSAGYTQLTVPFTTGASTTHVTVFVHGWYAQGTIFADDFSVS